MNAEAELRALIPQDKFDREAVEKLIARGYPAVSPILPDVFSWTQDGNWPVARPLMSFFSSLGGVSVPFIREVIQSNDADWAASLFWGVVWGNDEIIRLLEDDLARIIAAPTDNERLVELDSEAREILQDYHERTSAVVTQ